MDSPSPVRILLADDDPINREIVVAMLENHNYSIESVDTGPAAIEAVRRNRFDMLLLDGQMPGCSGEEVARAIRKEEGERLPGSGERLPIVALTALAATSDRDRCLASGMDDYLSKPFDRTQLLEAIRRWLPARRGGDGIPASAAAAGDRVVNREAVDRIAALDEPGRPVVLQRTVALFATEAARLASAIETLLVEGDWQLAAMTAHRLKSASGSLGAERVAAWCKRIEGDPQSAGREPAATAVELRKEIAAACGILDEMVRKHGQQL